MNTAHDVKYVAQVSPVQEVSLLGTAALEYWAERLAPVGLCPNEIDGQAQMMIGATEARFMGIRFREFTVCVACRPDNGDDQDGVYLEQAFSSVRWFAWVERHWFGTPYDHAAIAVDAGLPASLQLTLDDEAVVSARMAARGADERPKVDGVSWTVRVWLPRGRGGARNFFWAKIAGETQSLSFDSDRDIFELRSATQQPIVESLIESGFVAREWTVREAADHAKSKTYRLD